MAEKESIVEKIVEPVEEPVVEVTETPAPAAEPEFCVVANCEALNIRERPNKKATILCVVKEGEELMISPDDSTDDWYCVYTKTGVEGFCMKEFTR